MKSNEKFIKISISITLFASFILLIIISKKDEYYLNYNILEHMKNGMDSPQIVEMYQENIKNVDEITNGSIKIMYFDIDLNDNGLMDKVVIIMSPLHSGSHGDMFEILINNGDSYITSLSMTISLYSQKSTLIPKGAVKILKSKNSGFRGFEIETIENTFFLIYENGKYKYHHAVE